MTTRDEDFSEDVHATHSALLSLHRAAGTVGAVPPSAAHIQLGEALATVATSSPTVISLGAKLNLLGALAAAGLPGFDEHGAAYHELAGAIGAGRGVGSAQVIEDIKAHLAGAEFATTNTGRALPHEVAAFFMQDVCATESVVVEAHNATWVFSEFETDASYEDVARWVDPHNWPDRSPMMFKGMEPIQQITSVPSPATVDQWHGLFLETVQLVDRLETELYCDYYRMGDLFTGMTYSLARSRDNQINVDRGFLLVNELGVSRHVKALKIVGFTSDVWDDVARWVCPVWTDFIRGAVRGGTTSGGRIEGGPPGSVAAAIGHWLEFSRSSAAAYARMAAGWTRRAASGTYRAEDLLRDGARFWLQAYRDAANAAALSYATLELLAQERAPGTPGPPFGTLSGIMPEIGRNVVSAAATPAATRGTRAPRSRGASSALAEAATIPVVGLDVNAPLVCSDLVRIGSEQTAIPAANITVTPVPLTATTSGVRIEATVAGARDGLYVGTVTAGVGGRRIPVQLYVSRAVTETTP